jgi:hypothetical protein
MTEGVAVGETPAVTEVPATQFAWLGDDRIAYQVGDRERG